MAGRLVEHARAVHDASALRVLGAETQRLDAGQRHRPRAHRAWLQRHPDCAAVQAGFPQLERRRPNRDDFRVRRGVEAAAHRIARLGDDFAAFGNDRSDRHFAVRRRLAGKIERPAHR